MPELLYHLESVLIEHEIHPSSLKSQVFRFCAMNSMELPQLCSRCSNPCDRIMTSAPLWLLYNGVCTTGFAYVKICISEDPVAPLQSVPFGASVEPPLMVQRFPGTTTSPVIFLNPYCGLPLPLEIVGGFHNFLHHIFTLV